MIEVGTWVWSEPQKNRAKVIEVTELWGTTQLRIWLPTKNMVLTHSREEVTEMPEQTMSAVEVVNEFHIRFAAVVGKVAALINDDNLLAPLDSAVTPLPQQHIPSKLTA